MFISSHLLAIAVAYVDLEPPVQEGSNDALAINNAVRAYETGDYAASASRFRTLLNPNNANVTLSPKQWYNLLMLAVLSHQRLVAGKPADVRQTTLNYGVTLCARFRQDVRELEPPRECESIETEARQVAADIERAEQEKTRRQAVEIGPQPGKQPAREQTDHTLIQPESGLKPRQKVGVGLAAVGGLSLLAAGALGIATWRTGVRYAEMACTTEFQPDCAGLYDRGRAMVVAQWATLGVGGALAVVGAVLAIPRRDERKAAVRLAFGPRHTGIALRWSF